MKVAITLGNRINDDGSLTKMMIKRLEMTYELYKQNFFDKIIVSGGVANPKVNASEADMMKKYLINKGVPENIIYEENKSDSTYENALFSVPIAIDLKADVIVVISTVEHFSKVSYNTMKYFADAIGKRNIKLMMYTDCEDYYD
mgnify:CR=1 FL=1